jgi:hypothetical protein
MNKRQGLALGAVLAAGLLLRPGAAPSRLGEQPGNNTAVLNAAGATEAEGEGPWEASCQYWAPLSPPKTGKKPDTSPNEFHDTLQGNGNRVQFHVQVDAKDQSRELPCGGTEPDRWGFPNDSRLNVTTLIATVPDPVHAHLALNFDRTIDALLQAAADNGYLPSYYWLPWKNRVGPLKAAEAEGNAEPGHDPERERKPGLIVLRHVPGDSESSAPLEDSYYKVVYVFLIGETPTLGVNLFQLQRAFAYETGIGSAVLERVGKFSSGWKPGSVAIVGPQFSGSAASLRAGIESERQRWASETQSWPQCSGSSAVETQGEKESCEFDVAGATSTAGSVAQLLTPENGRRPNYASFAPNHDYDSRTLWKRLTAAGYSDLRFTLLIEDDTALGSLATGALGSGFPVVRFPRDISLLRNAQADENLSANDTSPSGPSVRSPYLRFSLRDPSGVDSIPDFSREHTPVSQEAQLMTIGRQLQRYRSQFIGIVASNILDQIFLAQFLHRACPDARLVFFESDLLMVREVDNVPFIGSITITPYSLIGLASALGPRRAYPDSVSEAYYNAVVYEMWDRKAWNSNRILKVTPAGPADKAGLKSGDVTSPITSRPFASRQTIEVKFLHNGQTEKTRLVTNEDGGLGIQFEHSPLLQGYRNLLSPTATLLQPSLWATAIGSDGYYPLGLLSACASDRPQILPVIYPDGTLEMNPTRSAGPCEESGSGTSSPRLTNSTIYPGRLWGCLCILVLLLCGLHIVGLLVASYWSPLTRDLAIRDNDQPRRRSMCTHVATAMLASLAFVVAFPVISLMRIAPISHVSEAGSLAAFIFLLSSAAVTLWKTWGYCGLGVRPGKNAPVSLVQAAYDLFYANRYLLVNLLAWTAFATVIFVWRHLCVTYSPAGSHAYLVGASFAYRCLNPSSGVSPLVPIALLLFCWYLWAFYRTRRLRFSEAGRPWLPSQLKGEGDRFFVSDEELRRGDGPRDCCLYDKITSLLITRHVLSRFRTIHQRRNIDAQATTRQNGNQGKVAIDIIVVFAFGVLLVCSSFLMPVRSLDHFLWNSGRYWSDPYEFLVGVLSLPLIAICVADWLRVILIWSALKGALLERLENLPIRFALSRLKVMGWLTMLSQSGQREQWRDMARSAESMGQLLNEDDSEGNVTESARTGLEDSNLRLLDKIKELRSHMGGPKPGKYSYQFMAEIEREFAAFCQKLLEGVLIPYWTKKRTGLVESQEFDELPVKARRSPLEPEHPYVPMELRAGPASSEPAWILEAEEFVAIRYLSLIRAILANMRYLMVFISATFVLAIVAWNSYPFQPRQLVDDVFTGLLLLLGAGAVWVLAQMHRDSILSRITDTKANELGWDFYLRVVSFGAIPVLAWLAYQFPDISSLISGIIQPAVPVVK